MAERFFFVHLQKTGGTALFQRLRATFGPPAVYPLPDDKGDVRAVLDVKHLIEQFRRHREDIRVVTGHFPLCAVEVLEGPFTTFTLLRDPVERTLSTLRRRKVAEERFVGLELEAIYDDPAIQAIVRNHMVKMLSLSPAEMTDTPLTAPVDVDDSRLDRAKENLRGAIDVFGFQEHFDDFCGRLEARYGWDLGPPRFANRTRHGPVSDGLRERIATDSRLDVELYQYAQGLSDERDR